MKCSAQALPVDQMLSIPEVKVLNQKKTRATVRNQLCRQCQERLPFLRSFFKHKFCNAAHERSYLKNMEELALERLRISAERIKLAASQSTNTTLDEASIAA